MNERINLDELKRNAAGKWIDIFRSLGMDVREDGRHGPCPCCGGKDRFRLKRAAAEDGRWFCSQCTPQCGDGFELVKNVLGVDFKEAMEAVAGVVGMCKTSTVPREKKMASEDFRKMFTGAAHISKNDPAGKYLRGRSITTLPECGVWYQQKCWEAETKKKQKAMLAIFTLPDSTAVCVHRTYLDDEYQKLDIKKPKKLTPVLNGGKLAGGAIRLFPVGETLGIAEGIENALAASGEMKIPVWAAVSSTLMESFEPPRGVKTVVVIGDNDKNFAGQKAAYKLANRIVIKYKRECSVYIPTQPGDDFLDEVRKR